jgi:hypothetical protein
MSDVDTNANANANANNRIEQDITDDFSTQKKGPDWSSIAASRRNETKNETIINGKKWDERSRW